MGTEMEYDVQGAPYTAGHVLKEGAPSLGYKYIAKFNGFMPNGARMYPDVDHLEYATPECLSGSQLALAEHAGRIIVSNIASLAAGMHKGVYERVVSVNYQEPWESNETTGYHENYCIPDSHSTLSKIREYLPTFLATRIIWSGSGFVHQNGYRISQKADGIGTEFTTDFNTVIAEGEKPMVLITGEGGNNEVTRCEIRCCDPTQSWFAKRLSFNATSLCLRLLETNYVQIKDTLPRLAQPVEALHRISRDTSLTGTYALVDGSAASATEIQLRYAEAALRLSRTIRLSPEETEAARTWYTFVLQLHKASGKNLNPFADRIAWIARAAALDRILGDNASSRLTRKSAYLDAKWDRIDVHDIGRRAFSHHFSEADRLAAEELVTAAPSNTRAGIRGRLLAERKKRSLEKIDWGSATFLGGTVMAFDPWRTGMD